MGRHMMRGKVGAIIQARMGSTRLPRKVLKKIGNKPLLEIIVNRIRNLESLDEIVIATSTNELDDKIEEFCTENSLNCFRGSEENVLRRFKKAADEYSLDTIVRVTGDNPLVSPKVLDELLTEHINKSSDYTYPKNVPLGTGVEIIEKSIIDQIEEKAVTKPEKEHVTYYIRKYTSEFNINSEDFGLEKDLRLTVDTEEDLKLIRKINEKIGAIEDITISEVIQFFEENPNLKRLNSEIEQKKPADEDKAQITVLIRTYNSEEYVSRAIESALNQSLMDDLYEILIIDDDSTDKTREIIGEYQQRNPDMIKKIYKEHTGPIENLNVGIKKSFKFFIILDSDDEFEKTILEKMLKIHERKNVGFVYCDYYEMGFKKDNKKYVSVDGNLFNLVAGGIMFKTELVKEMGYFDPNLIFPEYDLFLKFKENGIKGKYIDEPLYIYNRTEKSITSDKRKIKKGKKELKEKWGKEIPIRDY